MAGYMSLSDHDMLERYRQIMENAGYVFFTANQRGVYTHVNAAVKQLTGYAPEELIGESFSKIVRPDWLKAVVQFYFEPHAPGEEATYELPIITRDGEERWCEVTIIATGDPDTAYQAVVHDITGRHGSERQLREKEQRLRGLFEHSYDAIFFLGLDGIIQDANQRAADLLNFAIQDLIGTPIQQYIKLPQTEQLGTVVETLLHGANVPVYERVFIRRDGSEVPVEINDTLVHDADGKPLHIQRIVRDISERKQTQQQLAERIQQLTTLREVDAELAERLDVDYVLTMALDSAVRLCGADVGVIALVDEQGTIHQAKLVGDYPLDMAINQFQQRRGTVGRAINSLKAEFIPDVLRDMDYVVINPRTRSKIVIPLVSQERLVGILNLESNRIGMFNEDRFQTVQMLAARIAAAIDNAHLYRQSETQLVQLRDLYAQVSKLEQLKTDMIRIASHDLRNPLSAISGFIELIKLDINQVIDPEDLLEYLKNMDSAVKRMQRIITDILSLERIEEAVSEGEEAIVNFTELVQQVVRESEPQAVLHSRHLSLDIEDPLPLMVKGQAAQLHEAMSNLISNAIKYTPINGHVDVMLRRQGGRVIFEVKDDGYGIPQEAQERLFQPFYRAKSKETENVEGTGLGLHLVKKIVERFNGKMIFESTYGKGSTFGFTLPWAME